MNQGRQRYSQTILEVNLDKGTVERCSVPAEDVRKFLGGRGVAAAILAREGETPLVFSMGTLSGTHVPMSGRSSITFVSPATGLYCKANVGGHFGVQCALNGIDQIVLRGKSDSPVYLWIDGEQAQLRDAGALWGCTVRKTTESLEATHGPGINVACIGPAGENLVRFAAVMSSHYNAAARGGGGAVMGSKGVKAIVVSEPRGSIAPVDAEGFHRARLEVRDALYADTMADSYYNYGTAASVEMMNELGTLPSYNFQKGSIEEIEQLTSQYWNKAGLLKGRIGCASCIYSCHRFIRIDDGPYAGAFSAGPEYETVTALGTGTGISSIGALQRANELCNDLGMDTISAGGVIQWAMETFERGALPDEYSEGVDLAFGSEQAVTELPNKIALREGKLGDLLADGVRMAADRIGGESWKWAVHTRGMEQSRVETRGALGYALAFAMNPRGPDHLHTECLAEFGMTPEMRKLIKEIAGEEGYARPDIPDKRAEIVRWHEDIYAVSDALGLCAFVTTAAYGATPDRCARLFSSMTGIEMDAEAIMEAGRRIVTLERLINLRLGWREDPASYAPWRLMNERQASLPHEKPILDVERMQRMVREYYALHGWAQDTGVPLPETLTRLDLTEFGTDAGGAQ